METNSQPTHHSDEWLEGYEAALNDALAIVEAMGGAGFKNLSAPVLLRLKTRLVELRASNHEAAA